MHTQPFQNDDCFAIRLTARQISQFYERYLSGSGITPSQYGVLSVLGRTPGLTMANLSADLVIERTTLLRTLKPLLKSQFIASSCGANDKRRLFFYLTVEGEQKLAEAHEAWLTAQKEFEQRIGADDAARLRVELHRIRDGIATR